ncbi:MAG: transposase [Clostridia bacterium]|nr:transposase [Clostridia bacterium]MBQ7093191.1 transposase [Clostridia bacterium]
MDKPKRKPTRLRNYDYSASGAYFITICTKNMFQYFGRIIVGEPLAAPVNKLSYYGKIAESQLKSLPDRYENIEIDKYVVMPNHIHFILQIKSGGASTSPTISDIVRTFKSLTMRICRSNGYCGETLFQRSFHDHIIRSEDDYKKIWEYIDTNVIRWKKDCFYSEC